MSDCLFAFEEPSLLFDCFPRCGSTVVLSNIAFHGHQILTNYRDINVNQLRPRLHPKSSPASYSHRVLLVREPLDRLESYFVTKLCRGEPKSVLAYMSLIFPDLKQLLSPTIAKLFKPLFFNTVSLPSFIAQYPSFNEPGLLSSLKASHSYLASLTFDTFVNDLSTFGLPPDKHLTPQSLLKSFRLSEYTRIYNTTDFNELALYYQQITAHNFDFGYNTTQPNNRLHHKLTKTDPHTPASSIQALLLQNKSPFKYDLFTDSSIELASSLYRHDTSLFSSTL